MAVDVLFLRGIRGDLYGTALYGCAIGRVECFGVEDRTADSVTWVGESSPRPWSTSILMAPRN
eukprot:1639968-Prorocentrum_lima.AAC.1